ncbi:major facilitator superfamily MFS-1 [Xylariomycetidae sp. FL2044]|nr:major facilitator superfamily MFS-1 [Xylariomycetidae sp. FL2044]
MSRTREALFVAPICMAQLCTYAGLGQTLSILRSIGNTFEIVNLSTLSWAVAGYSMALGTFVLIAGRMGDTLGYKRVFLTGLVWSAAWSAVVGASVFSSQDLFTVARCFQGLGAALCLPNGVALLGLTYPPGKHKVAIFTLLAAMSPIGLLTGAAGAGALTLFWWPLAYWIFSLFLLCVAGMGYLAIPHITRKDKVVKDWQSAVTELDIAGAFSGASSLVLIGFATIQSAIVGLEHTPYLWVALGGGVLLAILFVLIETFYAPRPLIPLGSLPTRAMFMLTGLSCSWCCVGSWLFYTWQFVEVLRDADPLLASLWFSPIAVVGCLTVLLMGFMIHHIGSSIILCGSLLAVAGGAVLIATMPIAQTYWAQLFASVLVMSWGMETSLPAATLFLSNAIEKRHETVIANLISAVFHFSMAVGIGVSAIVESIVSHGDMAANNKLLGFRTALYTAAGFGGLGLFICIITTSLAYRQRRQRCCNCHGVVGDHHQI